MRHLTEAPTGLTTVSDRHFHLDPVGGISGDMFIAALLDTFPDLAEGMMDAIRNIADVPCRTAIWRDETIVGSRFLVGGGASVSDSGFLGKTSNHHSITHIYPAPPHHHANALPELTSGHDGHGHTHWRAIRSRIEGSGLPSGVRDVALLIFGLLAEAEAEVHGVKPDEVVFHEVGNADSIADIVGAAFLIDAVGPATWSVGKLPLGGGLVRTAHGKLPVPAPAAALLLKGFEFFDDGVAGERVTPTGAAILKALDCVPRIGIPLRLAQTGIGFGTQKLPGMPNILRVTVFSKQGSKSEPGQGHRELGVIAFEVDDQTPEDMAIALERLRKLTGIHDVLQMPAIGKKGRLTTHVQVLSAPEAIEDAINACFHETTTIGLRVSQCEGRALPRKVHAVSVGERKVRLKSVARPQGLSTVKAEADDLCEANGQQARSRLRREAEAQLGDD